MENEKIIEAVINEDWDKSVRIGKTPYFEARLSSDETEVTLTDLNGNYTVLDKQELKDMINLLNKCIKSIK